MKKRDDIYISQILDRIKNTKKHLKKLTREKFLKSPLHRSAVVRELEVIGEAAKLVSEETRQRFPQIPWAQIIGMRNRLIHEYFDVDYGIVWDVAKLEVPNLETELNKMFLEIAPPIHPWRVCPIGYYYVNRHQRVVPKGLTSVRQHCRRNPSGKDQLYPKEIKSVTDNQLENPQYSGSLGKISKPSYANDYDQLILIWTQYWNDIFSPMIKLNPNIVKALMGSESTFNVKVLDQKINSKNFARGLMQISDQTREILSDEKGELKQHYFTITKDDVKKPEIAIASSIRWLFHKKDTASHYLKSEATWEEATADYKGYLRRKQSYKQSQGMKNFFELLYELEKNK